MTTKITSRSVWRVAAVAVATLALLVPAAAQKKDKAKDKDGRPPVPDLVWPLPPEKPRIRYLGMLATNLDVEPPKKKGWLKRLIDEDLGQRVLTMQHPSGVAVDSKDRVFVTDTGRGAVFIFDVANKKLDLLGADGGRGRLASPFGVAIDRNDRIFVSDTALKCVNVYSSAGELIGVIGRVGNDALVNPTGLAIDEINNRLVIVDSKAHRLLVVNLQTLSDGVWFTGGDDQRFYFPSFVATDAAGRIYVTDTLNFCVKIFEKDFKFVRQIGEHSTTLGNFDRPKGVAIDSEGNLYVVDMAFSNFQIFNQEGQLLLFVGAFGDQPGTFQLPSGMCIDKRDRIYVVDSFNARVQMFQFLGSK